LGKRTNNKDIAVLLLSLALYCSNRFILKPLSQQGIIGNILRNHFNDYLGAIVFLAYTNILVVCAGYPAKRINSFIPILCLGLLCAIVWEGLLPLILPYSTADFLDCIAYLLGAITYWVINNAQIKNDG